MLSGSCIVSGIGGTVLGSKVADSAARRTTRRCGKNVEKKKQKIATKLEMSRNETWKFHAQPLRPHGLGENEKTKRARATHTFCRICRKVSKNYDNVFFRKVFMFGSKGGEI